VVPAEASRKAKRKRRRKKPAVKCRPVSRRKPKKRPKARRSGYSSFDPQAEVAARRKRRRVKACKPKRKRVRKPVFQPAPPPPAPPQPSGPPPDPFRSPISTYSGPFGRAQAERLLWRAGFGPSPGWPEVLAALGVHGSVRALVHPDGPETFTGAAPTWVSGGVPTPILPLDRHGHDHLFWLDRMVRTNQPLVQRMALIWHDWFATSDAGIDSRRMMLDQYELFRAHGRGSFEDLVRRVTTDPAMIIWLNQNENRRNAINENYARELMELFTLGADRGAYSEQDVRQLARSLSGWRADWTSGIGWNNFRWDPGRWDAGSKTVFGQTGAFTWEDAYRMCVRHPMHASFFVEKLWSYFIPTPPPPAEAEALARFYVESGRQIAPVVRAILLHPHLYEGPRMVKPPVVYTAGLLRALRRAVDTEAWYWLGEGAGQRLFWPPDVAGWDDSRWLDTSTVKGRWEIARQALSLHHVGWSQHGSYGAAETPQQAVDRALATWAGPGVTAETRASLLDFASTCMPPPGNGYQQNAYRAMRQNALLQLIATSPDLQTS
jgi:uncharacterized protein DUF1800